MSDNELKAIAGQNELEDQMLRELQEEKSELAPALGSVASCETCKWFGQEWNASPCEGCTMNPVHEKPTATNCYTDEPSRGRGRETPLNS